jgi:hypothetical protein
LKNLKKKSNYVTPKTLVLKDNRTDTILWHHVKYQNNPRRVKLLGTVPLFLFLSSIRVRLALMGVYAGVGCSGLFGGSPLSSPVSLPDQSLGRLPPCSGCPTSCPASGTSSDFLLQKMNVFNTGFININYIIEVV